MTDTPNPAPPKRRVLVQLILDQYPAWEIIEHEINIPGGATDAEIMDTLSRCVCEAYRVAKIKAESS